MEDSREKLSEYIGDAVYASFDGYQIWLKTGSHKIEDCQNIIAIEPAVFKRLLEYVEKLKSIGGFNGC